MPLNKPLEAARVASCLLFALALTASAPAAVPNGAGADEHRILVSAVTGDVEVTMANHDVEPRVGDEVLLPARVVTGDDGTLGLEQGRTTISIAPSSEIEIPEAAHDGQLIGRLVQWRGNVFYDVETREVERLTVETPYLVAVVKGTQFNVAVLDGTTTISLFEGRLEIRDPDGRNVVDLEAGEVAIRSRDDTTIRVIDTNVAELPTLDRNGSVVAAAPERGDAGDALTVVNRADPAISQEALGLDAAAARGTADLALRSDVALGAEVVLNDPAMLAAAEARGVDTALGSIALDAGLGAGADLGSGGVDLGATAVVDTGSLSADLGLGVSADLGTASIGADLGADVDLGGGSVDLGLGTDASVADLGLDASTDLGVSADLAGGALDAGLGADLGAGDLLGADLDTSLGVDDGGLAASVDTGVDLGGTGLDAGLDAGVDLGDTDVAAGLDVGGLVDAGVDAGLDLTGEDAGLDADVTLPGGIDASLDIGGDSGDGGLLDVVDVDLGGGGLLGGLL